MTNESIPGLSLRMTCEYCKKYLKEGKKEKKKEVRRKRKKTWVGESEREIMKKK